MPTSEIDSTSAALSIAPGNRHTGEPAHWRIDITMSSNSQRLDPGSLRVPKSHVRAPSQESAGSRYSWISGPVGDGRTALLIRRPQTEKNPVLVYDQAPPARKGDMSFFRCTADLSSLPPGINTRGMDTLRLAGCERISSVEQVRRVMDAFGGEPLDVIDLREELHVVADDYPISLRGPRDWVNVRLPLEDVERMQADWPEQLRKLPELNLLDAKYVKGKSSEPGGVRLVNPKIRTVRELVEAAGSRYHTVPSPDHMRPGRDRADRFIGVARQVKGPVLVMCNGGRGRTTTYMIKYDMLRNAVDVSADDIILRQSLLGYDYNMTDHEAVSEHKQLLHIDRLAFLREYHSYAAENPNGWPLLYSEWRLSDSGDIAAGIGSWLGATTPVPDSSFANDASSSDDDLAGEDLLDERP